MPDAWAMNASGGAPSYTAAELRRIASVVLSPKGTAGSNRFAAVEGIRPGGAVIASLSGSTITVRAHAGVISPDLTTTQGPYQYQLAADETHSLTAAHATLSRTDLVYIQVSDNDEDASGARTVASGYLAGTAGGGVPSLPARSFEIARIAVPNSGGGSPTLTERNRYTVASGGVLPVRDATDQTALTGYEGQAIYRLDLNALLLHDGTAFRVNPGAADAASLVELVPGGNTDSPAFTGLWTTWLTLANVTVPAWATQARFLVTITGWAGASAVATNKLRLNVGAVADGAEPILSGVVGDRRVTSWQGRITGLSTGSQALLIENNLQTGAGVFRADTGSHIGVSFFWEP